MTDPATPPSAPPKRKRRWGLWVLWTFSLLVAALVVTRMVAGYVMESRFEVRIDALRKAGEPVTLEEMMPPEVPEDQNAATLYEQAFKELDAVPKATAAAFWKLARKGPDLTAEDVEQARSVLASYQTAVRLLREGAARPRCVYSNDYRIPGFRRPLRHLSWLQAGCLVLGLSCQVNIADGRPKEAVDDALAMLALARSLRTECNMVSTMVGVTTTDVALGRFQTLMNALEIPPAALEAASLVLGDPDDRTELVRAMQAERIDDLVLLDAMMNHPRRFCAWTQTSFSYLDIPRTYLCKPWALETALSYLDVMDRFVAIAGMNPPEAGKELSVLNRQIVRTKAWRNPLVGIKSAAYESAISTFDVGACRRGCARIAIALRLHRMKHGAYPETLDALVPEFLDKLPLDPFSGKSYVYRREGNGFVVYSVGHNGVDDGGVENNDRDQGDIVWKCLR